MDGTNVRPSGPGRTTGVFPFMNAMRELVVPRSIPTMRAIYANASLRFCSMFITYVRSERRSRISFKVRSLAAV